MGDTYTHTPSNETFPCDSQGRPLISIFRINTSNRKRIDYGDISGLKDSIQKRGFIHAICLSDDKDEKGQYRLLAGGRRTRAAFELKLMEIPFVFKSNLSEIEKREIELEENLHRKDFDMLEECELTREIDELHRSIHGSKGSSDNDNAWTMEKTAERRGKSTSAVSLELKVANAVKDNPVLKEEIRSRKMPITRAAQYVDQVKKLESLNALKESGQLKLDNRILLGDCNVLIQTIQSCSIHCILTDPPYGNETIAEGSGSSRGEGGGQSYLSTLDLSDNLSSNGLQHVVKGLFPELFRVLIPGGFLYLFHSEDSRHFLTRSLREAGFEVVLPSLIWNKGRNMNAFSGYNYMSMYEPILFAFKPPRVRRLNFAQGNILEVPPISSNNKTHAFEKPSDLLRILVENSTNPGEIVLDPFCGSGSTIKVAQALGRSGVGFEINEKNFAQAQENLKS